MFPIQDIWLDAKHPGNTHKGEQEKEDLNKALAGIQLSGGIDGSGREEHVDKHVEQSGRRVGLLRPVKRPFVDNANDEVSKDTLHEQYLRDKFTPNVDVLLELKVVRYLEADRESHLPVEDQPKL